MGQRHQVFIKVPNPVKVFGNRISKDKKKYTKMFGRNKYTVMAFHHGWIFGLSSVYNVKQVLQFVKSCKEGHNRNLFDEENIKHAFSTPEQYIQFITNLISIVVDPNCPRGCGYENYLFLNDSEPEMRMFYDGGDNNDGITIIDTITNKYCFMNIGGDETMEQAERDVPISAQEYACLYYPQSGEAFDARIKFREEYFNEKYDEERITQSFYRGGTREEAIKENIEDCKVIFEQMSEFEVLTKAEIEKMFPKTVSKTVVK